MSERSTKATFGGIASFLAGLSWIVIHNALTPEYGHYVGRCATYSVRYQWAQAPPLARWLVFLGFLLLTTGLIAIALRSIRKLVEPE